MTSFTRFRSILLLLTNPSDDLFVHLGLLLQYPFNLWGINAGSDQNCEKIANINALHPTWERKWSTPLQDVLLLFSFSGWALDEKEGRPKSALLQNNLHHFLRWLAFTDTWIWDSPGYELLLSACCGSSVGSVVVIGCFFYCISD